jgi:SAM-dependent methyltransferase
MKAIACPLCTSSKNEVILSAPEFVLNRSRYALTRCRDCTHVFVNPAPDPAELESFYAEVTPLLRAKYPIPPGRTENDLAQAHVEQEKVGLIRDLGLLKEKGSLLDIGYGNGAFILAMSQLGWSCTGIEFTDKVDLPFDPAGRFEVRLGFDALRKLPEKQFDVITLWHVLEHLTDPIAELRWAKRALKPGGRILVAVPNFASLTAKLFRQYWYGLVPPWHLHQFQPRTLELALAEAGFALDEIRGFGELSMRLFWTGSMTQMMEQVPPGPARAPFVFALRVLRRGTVVGSSALAWVEEQTGRPGAIVAVAGRNGLEDRAVAEGA